MVLFERSSLSDMGVEGYPEYNTTWRLPNGISDPTPIGSPTNY